MKVNPSKFQRQESSLTVVRGSIGTVLMNWSRLDDGLKQTLLATALERVEDLVLVLEEDAGQLRLGEGDSK